MTNEIEINATADEKFAAMQRLMTVIYPGLVTFYCMTDKRHNDKITLRLNTRTGTTPIIEYNEKFIEAISLPTFTALISIELFRLLLHHTTIRMMLPAERNMKASNIICTDDKIFKVRIPHELAAEFPNKDMLYLLEPNFNMEENFYLEYVFGLLGRAETTQQPNANGEEPAETDNSKFDSETDAIKKHFSQDNMRKNTEGWGENEMIDTQVADAVNRQSVKDWGDMPAHLKDMIMLANTKKFDPRSVINRFVTSVFSDEISFTRMKPSRRHQGNWIGVIPGKRHAQKAKVLFAIDTSGSMPQEEIEKGIGVIESSLKHAECHYCFWDAACSPITEERRPSQSMEVIGGGGTDPSCVIKKIQEEKLVFDGIVFITDCYFSWAEPNIKTKIFILQSANAGEVPVWCKYHLTMDDIAKIA